MTDLDLTDRTVREKVNKAIAEACGWTHCRILLGTFEPRERMAWVRDENVRLTCPDYLGGSRCEEMEAALRERCDSVNVDWSGVAALDATWQVKFWLTGQLSVAGRIVHAPTKAEALARALLAAKVATLEESQ